MVEKCVNCEVVRDKLVDRFTDSSFGKLIEKCSQCESLWVIDKHHREPYVLQEDVRVSTPRNRQAFVNDPRRKRPQ